MIVEQVSGSAWAECPNGVESAPTHNERFISILTEHYPTWREARAELNELPLTAEVWRE